MHGLPPQCLCQTRPRLLWATAQNFWPLRIVKDCIFTEWEKCRQWAKGSLLTVRLHPPDETFYVASVPMVFKSKTVLIQNRWFQAAQKLSFPSLPPVSSQKTAFILARPAHTPKAVGCKAVVSDCKIFLTCFFFFLLTF